MPSEEFWQDKTVLITGGTGSFGRTFARLLLEKTGVRTIRTLSRGEYARAQMGEEFAEHKDRIRYLIGDVRDRDRVYRAMYGVDVVLHAAALKRIEVVAYNPDEAVKTNVLGTLNVVEAAIDNGVKKVLALSTDKSPAAVTLYGNTKATAEGLVIQGNALVGDRVTALSCVRYGNVFGSRGSVTELFYKQVASGKLTITDKRMTRFFMTLPEASAWVKDCVEDMAGGETYVKQVPSVWMTDVARAIAPEAELIEIGEREGGERIHELLISREESVRTAKRVQDYVISPPMPSWQLKFPILEPQPEWEYKSDTNPQWLATEQIRERLDALREVA